MEKLTRYPFNGTFELTARCNLSCKMCYVRIDNNKIKESGKEEKSAKEWIDMARQAFEEGTISLLLTGGEPMLRPDFCEIYEEIAKMGFIITLYTNATMITPKIMHILKKYPPNTVGITLYGASRDTYKKVCGNADAYDKTIEGINELLQLPSKIEIRTTIIKDNLNDLKLIENYVKSIKRENIKFNLNRTVLNSVRGGISDPTICRLDPDKNAELYCQRYKDYAESYIKDKKSNVDTEIDEKYSTDKSEENVKTNEKTFYGCQAGCTEYYITWDGKLIPCTLMGKNYTEPFDEGLKNAWNRLEEVIEPSRTPKACIDCKYSSFCSACEANRYCETGDESGIPKYLCEEAKAFYKIFKENKGVIVNE